MLSSFTKYWWAFLLRGIAAIAFGVAALAWPSATLQILVWVFGAYLLVDGVSLFISLIAGDPAARRSGWSVALMGIISVVIGVASFIWTDAMALSLLYVIAFWAITTGVLLVATAIYFRREIDNEFWLALGGVSSVIFGILLIVFPGAGLLSLVWLVAVWSIVFGVANIGFSFRLHAVNGVLKTASSH